MYEAVFWVSIPQDTVYYYYSHFTDEETEAKMLSKHWVSEGLWGIWQQ